MAVTPRSRRGDPSRQQPWTCPRGRMSWPPGAAGGCLLSQGVRRRPRVGSWRDVGPAGAERGRSRCLGRHWRWKKAPTRFHPEWQQSSRQQRGKGCCLRSRGHSWGPPPHQPASARATDGGRRKQGGQTPECLSDSPGETIQTVGLGAPGRLSRLSV